MVKLTKLLEVRKAYVVLLAFLALAGSFLWFTSSVFAPPDQGWIIEGDTVYWNNSMGDVRVTPHTASALETINGKAYYVQYVNLTRHAGTANIDVAFGFDHPVKGGIDVWGNVITTSSQRVNQTVVITDYGNGTSVNRTESNVTTTTETAQGWVDRSNLFSRQEYQGTTYYFVRNINLQPSQVLQGRLRFEKSNFNLQPVQKWQFLTKLNSDTIAEAINNNRYILLDPWSGGGQQYQSPIPFGTGSFNWTSNGSASEFNFFNSTVSFRDSNVSARESVINIETLNNTGWTNIIPPVKESGCTMPDERLMCFGGTENSGATNTLRVLNTTNSTLNFSVASAGFATTNVAGCSNSTHAFFRGGGASTDQLVQMVRYDLNNGTLQNISQSPNNKKLANCFVHGTWVITPGGHDGSVSVNTVEVYNASNDTYTLWPSNLITATRNYGGALIDDAIYIVSGSGGGTDTQMINLTNGSVNRKTASPVSDTSICGANLNKKLYLYGSSLGGTRIFSYEPASDTFSNPSDAVLATGGAFDGQNCAARNNVAWIFGGDNGAGTKLNSVQRHVAPSGNGTLYSRLIVVGNISQNSQQAAFNLSANISTPTGTNVSFNISFDGGNTWVGRVPLNQNTSWTGADGTKLLLTATFTSGIGSLSANLFNFSVSNATVTAEVLQASAVLQANISIINSTSSNATVIRASEQLFSNANYSSSASSQEGNSTFKWLINNTNQSWGGGNKTTELVPMIYKDAVGYWHLDEAGGTNGYADSSGNGNTLIQNGTPANTSGIIKGALTFDSNNDLANASDAGSLTVTGNITLAMWLKLVGHPNNFNTVIQKGDGTAANNAYYMAVRGTAQLEFQLRQDVSNQNTLDLARILDNDTWYHVAATNNGTHLIFYLNGAEANKTAQTITSISNIITAFTIGGRFVAGRFNGSVDEVAIYNRSLSPSEIKQLYLRTWYDHSPQMLLLNGESLSRINASNQSDFNTTDNERPTAISGAVLQPGRYVENLTVDVNTSAYWRFDVDGSPVSGSTPDISGNGNNGSVQGASFVNDSAGGLALRFDGVNDYVNAGAASSLNITGTLTVSAWAKFSASQNNKPLVGRWGNDQAYFLGIAATNNKLQFAIRVSDVSKSATSANTYNNGNWHQFVGVFNGSHVLLYVDGGAEAIVGDATTGPIDSPANNPLVFGNYNSLAGNWFNGTIDEVRILNRSLSASEVLSDYRKAAKGLGLLSNSYINYSASGNFNEREGTVEFWVKPEWNGNDNMQHTIFAPDSTLTAATNDFQILKNANNDLRFFNFNPGVLNDPLYSISDWTSGQWRYVAATWNNYTSNRTLFVDGTIVNQSSMAFVIPVIESMVIGGSSAAAAYCNCTVSEFRISRKALTLQEINFSFSKSRSFFQNEYMLNASNYFKGDSLILNYLPANQTSLGNFTNSSILVVQNTPPVGNISFPTSGINTSLNWINVTNISDFDGDTITTYLYVNGSFNQSSGGNMTLAATPEKNYNITVSFFDGTEYTNNISVIYNFDNLTPVIGNATNSNSTLTTPTFLNKNQVFLNFTYTETMNHTFAIQNRSGNITNILSSNNVSFWMNFINLNDDNYSFIGWINDTSRNTNRTANTTFTIDTTPPNLTVNSNFDSNNSNITRLWFQINVSVTELYAGNITLQVSNTTHTVNNTNITVNTTPSTNFFNISIPRDARYNFTIQTKDRADNTNTSTNLTFLADSNTPAITTLTNITITGETNPLPPLKDVIFNATIIDVNLETVIFSINATNRYINYTPTKTGNIYNITIKDGNFSAGTFIDWYFWANDTLGNMAQVNANFTPTSPSEAVQKAPSGGTSGGSLQVKCDQYAQAYKSCYHLDEFGICQTGCQTGYSCGEDYTCLASSQPSQKESSEATPARGVGGFFAKLWSDSLSFLGISNKPVIEIGNAPTYPSLSISEALNEQHKVNLPFISSANGKVTVTNGQILLAILAAVIILALVNIFGLMSQIITVMRWLISPIPLAVIIFLTAVWVAFQNREQILLVTSLLPGLIISESLQKMRKQEKMRRR